MYNVNIPVVILVAAAAMLLLIFLVRRNLKDKKKFEKDLSESEIKPEKHSDSDADAC